MQARSAEGEEKGISTQKRGAKYRRESKKAFKLENTLHGGSMRLFAPYR